MAICLSRTGQEDGHSLQLVEGFVAEGISCVCETSTRSKRDVVQPVESRWVRLELIWCSTKLRNVWRSERPADVVVSSVHQEECVALKSPTMMTSVDLRLIWANGASREEVKRFTASVVPVGGR